jgi:hypothetical protein
MSTVLICHDALEDSVLSNLALARAVARSGEQVTVVFAGAALDALADGTFEWSWSFRTRPARAGIIRRAEEMGLSLADPDRDPRWSDARRLAHSMAEEPNVRLVACPIWTQLLDLEDTPSYLGRIDEAELVAALRNAETIVGGF